MSRAIGEELRDKYGYPDEIAKMDGSFFDLGLNHCVWDIEKRTMLKLVEGKYISRAFIGSRQLSLDEIVALYSNPPIFNTLKFPQTTRQIKT